MKSKMIKEKWKRSEEARGSRVKCFASYGGRSSLPDASRKWRNLVSQPLQKHFAKTKDRRGERERERERERKREGGRESIAETGEEKLHQYKPQVVRISARPSELI